MAADNNSHSIWRKPNDGELEKILDGKKYCGKFKNNKDTTFWFFKGGPSSDMTIEVGIPKSPNLTQKISGPWKIINNMTLNLILTNPYLKRQNRIIELVYDIKINKKWPSVEEILLLSKGIEFQFTKKLTLTVCGKAK